MIRIETEQSGDQVTLRVAGRLCGTSVEALEECWRLARLRMAVRRRPSVDLSDVTRVDQAGWQLLKLMKSQGAQVLGKGLATEIILDQLTDKRETY